jgi:hypothetical protein
MAPLKCTTCEVLIRDGQEYSKCPVCGRQYASTVRQDSVVVAWALVAIGLLSGVWATLVSLGMGGDGSGWLSPVKVCWVAMVAGPAAGIAWGLRRRASGFVLLALLLLIMLSADVTLIHLTLNEGLDGARHVWRVAPGATLLWLIAWCEWQLVVSVALLGRIRDFINRE